MNKTTIRKFAFRAQWKLPVCMKSWRGAYDGMPDWISKALHIPLTLKAKNLYFQFTALQADLAAQSFIHQKCNQSSGQNNMVKS